MPSEALTWTTETRDNAAIVLPSGRVDESTASEFAERLTQEVDRAARAGVARLVVDLAEIQYMSSRGLRGLTLAQRQSQHSGITIVLVRPNEVMREILAISRYDKVFPVFARIDEIDEA